MSDIKNLPGAGHNFRVTSGAGNFSKKFFSATKAGNLHNLADNRSAILKTVKKFESAIRIGKFDRLRQRSAFRMVKKEEGAKLTKDDKREIKAIFKHLGTRPGDGGDDGPKVKVQMQIARDEGYEEERKANIHSKIERFDRAKRTGGEARLNFASQPGDAQEDMTMSGHILRRRFESREELVKSKLPSFRITNNKPVEPPPPIARDGESHISSAPEIGLNNSKIPSGPKFQNL